MNSRGNSSHLENITAHGDSSTTMLVAFLDVEKFSQRRTRAQKALIDEFTTCVHAALTTTASKYLDYLQRNNLNFLTDIIRIPTGDGAAICFPFENLHDVHLTFAKAALEEAYKTREKNPCKKYDAQRWCDCHPNFRLRVGVAEGKAIIYKDLNGNFNAAGNVLNMAARVMSLIDPDQIAFTDHAHKQLCDMADESTISDRFKSFSGLEIKHGRRISIFQYHDDSLRFLNGAEPTEIARIARATSIQNRLTEILSQISDAGNLTTSTTLDNLQQLLHEMQTLGMSNPSDAGNVTNLPIAGTLSE